MKKPIQKYQSWFGSYAKPFLKDRGEGAYAIGLKIVHSQRVRREIVALGREIGLKGQDLLMAEVIGLFHDIGRFEQFERFKTFVDAASIDHALLSRKVLERENVLSDFSPEEKAIILDAIFYHNKLAIPSSFEGKRRLMAQLIRDADKLDILRVFDDLYKKGGISKTVNLGLPRSYEVSDKVIKAFLHEEVVNFKDVKTTTDFLVMRLSWLYDINFPETLKRILKRTYLKTMDKQLGKTAWKAVIMEKLENYCSRRLGGITVKI